MSETQRVSLHIGLNNVDTQRYPEPPKVLINCLADAEAMQRVAQSRGFAATMLLDEEATSAAVLQAMTDISGRLRSGDEFFLTYAGHGGSVDDLDGDELTESGDKPDAKDETWLLYDRQLIDDELFKALTAFPPGVRVFFLSDSCHSGTVTRGGVENRTALLDANGDEILFRWAPPEVTSAEFNLHRTEYESRNLPGTRASLPDSPVPVILLSACQDDQLADDGTTNGAFTTSFLSVWADGAFGGTYDDLHKAVEADMPRWQRPNLFPFGHGVDDMLATKPLAD